MNIQLRLLTVRVIQRMNAMPSYAESLGISDCSAYRGIPTTPPKESENKGGHPHGTL